MNLQWSLSLQLLLAINLQSQTTWKSLQFLHSLMPHSYFSPPQFGLHSDAPMNTLSRSHCQPDCQIQQALLVPISLHPTVALLIILPSWNSFLSMSMNQISSVSLPLRSGLFGLSHVFCLLFLMLLRSCLLQSILPMTVRAIFIKQKSELPTLV